MGYRAREDLGGRRGRRWSAARLAHARADRLCFRAGLARKLPAEVWPSAVVPQVRGAGARVDAALATAIASPVAQLLSVLFPTVDCSDALVGLLAELAQSSETLLAEPPSEHRDMIVLRLRAVVTGDGVLAWVLAFGPFDFWPPTRRGPGAELLFRVKPKPERIYPRLDQDRRIAHIADTPIAMADEDADAGGRAPTMRRSTSSAADQHPYLTECNAQRPKSPRRPAARVSPPRAFTPSAVTRSLSCRPSRSICSATPRRTRSRLHRSVGTATSPCSSIRRSSTSSGIQTRWG